MLLQKAKVITTPTAYSDGILHSVKPIEGDADFTFTRNSSATRVGEDGYIQDVQIIGGELVQNGDFEQIGSELVTNGSFDTDSDWVKSGWVIENGQASNSLSGAGHNLYQNNVTSVGKIFKVVIKTTISAGSVKVMLGGGTGGYNVIGEATTSGTFTYYGISNGVDNRLLLQTGVGTTIGSVSIDNVSVKEVGQNWTFSNSGGTFGWQIYDGRAICDSNASVPNRNLVSSASLTSGKKYRLKLDILQSNDKMTIYVGGGALTELLPTGTNLNYTLDFIAPASGFLTFYAGTSDLQEIDNISVKEVTDDTNLPRINYEGFSYENGLPIYGSGKGHFLLEGQSTNLLNYSEDFSEWTIQTNSIVTLNATISPDGNENAAKLIAGTSSARQSIVYSSAYDGDFSYSLFAKKGEYDVVQLTDAKDGSRYANFDLNNGVVGSYDVCTPSIEDYGNGWYRCVIAFSQVGLNSVRISIAESPTQARLVNFAGNGSDGIYIWGAMLEQGNISSYIPTNGSAVTRAAETCNNAGNADLFDSEGVLYVDLKRFNNDLTNTAIAISDGSASNVVSLKFRNTSNLIFGLISNGGVSQAVLSYTVSDITNFTKLAVRYKDNDFSLWVDGVQVLTDTSGTVPTGLSELAFDAGDGNEDFYGKTKMVGVFPYLSNDEMECLTGEGYGSFQAMALANNYTIIQG
jgi:hypothetical protein